VAQSASVNSELQSLNTALSALGLPQSDIAVIDRIAALLKDFSPSAYSDLLHQFETLAQSQVVPSAAASPSVASPIPAPSSSASAVPKGGSAPGATFRVQDLVIRFVSVTETQTNNTSNTQSGPQNATGSKSASSDSSTSASQVNVLNLGVEEISVTLNNSLGQQAHVHVPQSTSNKNSTGSPPSLGFALAKSANG
jgi:hypothetical protein